MFAVPIVQRVDALSLQLRTIIVHTTRVTTINGVNVDLTSCWQVRIHAWRSKPQEMERGRIETSKDHGLYMDDGAILLAAQHFIGKTDSEIENDIRTNLSSHQRAIIGVLTVEQLYHRRTAFSVRVLNSCFNDMRNMGLTVVSYSVTAITDELGYIEASRAPLTAIGKCEAKASAAIYRSYAVSRKASEEAGAYLHGNTEEDRHKKNRERSLQQAQAQKMIDRARRSRAAAEHEAVLLREKQKASAVERRILSWNDRT